MAVLSKAIYRLNIIPIRISMPFFTEVKKKKKSIPKFIWKHKSPWIVKAILNKSTNARGIIILNFKLYYRAVEPKSAWYWYKNKHVDQCSREGAQKPPDSHQKWQKEKIAFLTNDTGKTEYPHVEEWN
jgi:hypothetical protein